MDIKTFIFLDLETTGLPSLDNNTTKITEVCLLAVRSNHLVMELLPRVQNKISLCINPEKLIDDKANEITGLSNDLLGDQSTFDDRIFSIIQNFINLQQKPVCLIAHNGNGFDYPILRAEIYKSGNELPQDILCADSIQVFKGLNLKMKNGRFTLSSVYKTLVNKRPKNAHRAEGDVDLLVECATAIGTKFVEWCNQHATKFSDVPMMTSKKK